MSRITWNQARMRVAEWIRAGDPLIEETTYLYLAMPNELDDEPACGCALGTAWVGKLGHVEDVTFPDKYRGGTKDRLIELIPELRVKVARPVIRVLIDIPGIPWIDYGESVAEVVETLHISGVPRLKIADWLETGVLDTSDIR